LVVNLATKIRRIRKNKETDLASAVPIITIITATIIITSNVAAIKSASDLNFLSFR